MVKLFKLVNPQQASLSSKLATENTDWDRCVICQEVTDETLHCPDYSIWITSAAGYTTLAKHLLAFKSIDCFPKSVAGRLIKEGHDFGEIQ